MGGDELTRLIQAQRPSHRTSAGFVLETLRQAIVSGALPAGQALRQEELAARFGLSRMPIREALRQLEAEGLVVFTAHKGAVVARLSPADVEEITEMRLAAESLALRRALPRLTEAQLAEAEALLDEIDEEPELARFGELNRRFHFTLYAAAGRPRLLAHLATLHDAIDRYLRLAVKQLDYGERSQREHRQLLAACRKGDLAAAENVLAAHVGAAGEALAIFLAQQQSEGQEPRRSQLRQTIKSLSPSAGE